MKKRLICFLVVIAMLIPGSLNVYAGDYNDYVTVTGNMQTAQSGEDFQNEPIEVKKRNTEEFPTFDFRCTIYMDEVRNAFSYYMSSWERLASFANDDDTRIKELNERLYIMKVTGEFKINIKYPSSLEIPEEFLESGKMTGFSEGTKRVFGNDRRRLIKGENENIIEITASVVGPEEDGVRKGYMFVRELNENVEEYLPDLELTCEGIRPTQYGTSTVVGEMSGITYINGRSVHLKIDYDTIQAEGQENPLDGENISASVRVTRRTSGGTSSGTETVPEEKTNTLTFDIDGDKSTVGPITRTQGSTVELGELPTPGKEGYSFDGWYHDKEKTNKVEDDIVLNSDKTIYASWKEKTYTLTFDIDGDKSTVDPITRTQGSTVKTDELPFPYKEGYSFNGWYHDEEKTNKVEDDIVLNSDKTIYASWNRAEISDKLESEIHYAYVIGYPDGNVRPLSNVTREEVATIFFRLLKDAERKRLMNDENNFSDVQKDRWSNKAISTMLKGGYIEGYEDGTFAPEKPITRAEFATIASRLGTPNDDEMNVFSDISGHWAEKNIIAAVNKGWIVGYEDGTFRPDRYITRAEVMTIVNRMLNRFVKAKDISDDATLWPDNPKSEWYYTAVEEATNTHKYEDKPDGVYGVWEETLPVRDWKSIEDPD